MTSVTRQIVVEYLTEPSEPTKPMSAGGLFSESTRSQLANPLLGTAWGQAERPWLRPHLPVKHAVVDRLLQMLLTDLTTRF